MRMEDLATRPDLRRPALGLGAVGGEFLGHDVVGLLAKSKRLAARWPEFFLVLLDDDVPVARAAAIPVEFPTPERPELPEHGWDGALLWAAEDVMDGRAPTTLVAIEVTVAEHARGRGLAAVMLSELRARARAAGLSRLVVPVRPTGLEQRPDESIVDYVTRKRPDGSFADPWLRTHERLGARLIGVAPFAMTVTGTLAQWREWTGVEFVDGLNTVPGGLAPVLASVARDLGVYVEPNVWLDHPL
ncbi:GNAT family N-acetyltransferase [Amycolatopsis sp. NPDC059021]|uniref:GNAT family N-acetyltransferase n=1 Tax=Amycolatopsis sp. NPDC059021 TaxID=3346704 RepID=UPI00366AB5B7